MDAQNVLKLAQLSRIKLTQEEAESLSKDLEGILGYVAEVKKISADSPSLENSDFPNRNVLREDRNPHESAIYTETILAEAPARSDNFLKVKKIL